MGDLIKESIGERERERQKLYNYCNCTTAVGLMRDTVRQRIPPSLCLALQQQRRSLFHPKRFQTAKQHLFKTDFRGCDMYHGIRWKDLKRLRKVHRGDFLETRVEKNPAKVSGADR